MKRRDLLRLLNSQGCELLREGARHSLWRNASGDRRSAIPRHREIDDYPTRKIRQALGIPPP